jgi:hypothetical protein
MISRIGHVFSLRGMLVMGVTVISSPRAQLTHNAVIFLQNLIFPPVASLVQSHV